MGAFIRCYLHIDPDTLTDEEFARAWGQLKHWLIKTKQMEP